MDNVSKAGADAHETYQVGRRTYRRVKPEFVTSKVARRSAYQAPSASSENYEEPETCAVRFDAELPESHIKQTSSGFSYDLPVDPKFYNAIIGPKGASVTKMRQLTGCNISVPQKDSKSNTIALAGPTREAVEDAIKRILMVVNSSETSSSNARPKRLEFDFFVSLPLLDAGLAESVNRFYADAKGLVKAGYMTIEDNAYMKPNSLHFTLCMLHLHSPSNIAKATEILQSLAPEISELAKNKPIEVEWGKVTTFADAKIEAASIIFAEPGVKSAPTLQAIGNLIRSKFIEAGLVNDEKEESRGLTLHTTLINARPHKINATHLAGLTSASLAPLSVNEIHLSQRFNFDSNGYYHCAHKISIQH